MVNRAKSTKSDAAKPVASTGHTKLKQALALRDFLEGQLGLRLRDVLRHLNDLECRHGAQEAFTDGHYLSGLKADAPQAYWTKLDDLDLVVKNICRTVGLTPRYFQYLALLFAAHWFDRLAGNTDVLLDELNDFHGRWQSMKGRPAVAAFTPDDLQCAAFWMATAAGKTHLLHACLALLAKRRFPDGSGFGRLILITPSESLSRQHAESLRQYTRYEVFVYPDDGDARTIADLPSDAVVVIDINKLAESKKGEGLTVDISVFGDTRNLVFVDEGHKGQKTEASVWKRIQTGLAGVGHLDPKCQGMIIEFSATFGQVADAEHAFDRYAKSVLFDYAYDRFHADLYGKDFSIHNLQVASGWDNHEDALLVALVAYWHQLHTWNSTQVQVELRNQSLQAEQPLWVLLGLSVVGSKKDDELEYRSDIIEVLRFIATILKENGRNVLSEKLERLKGESGKLLLPETAWQAIQQPIEQLADTILREVFGYQPGATLALRALKSSSGELGLGLSLGDRVVYFGVVNVGDSAALKPALEPHGMIVETDAISTSLFAALDRPESGVNLLIGSRRFSEGWNNYRASSLTLLRLGSGEGPLIVQMFGRVVRFRGRNGDGKRLATPGPCLAPLQTAYVYGLRADYMTKFLDTLHKNDIEKHTEIIPTTRIAKKQVDRLLHLSASEPDKNVFSLNATGRSRWYKSAGGISLSLGLTIQSTHMRNGQAASMVNTLKADVKQDFLACVEQMNFDRIMGALLSFRATNAWWNVTLDRYGLRDALEHGKYSLDGVPDTMMLRSRDDIRRVEDVAITLLQRMLRSAYRRSESKCVAYRLELLSNDNELLVNEVFIRNDA